MQEEILAIHRKYIAVNVLGTQQVWFPREIAVFSSVHSSLAYGLTLIAGI